MTKHSDKTSSPSGSQGVDNIALEVGEPTVDDVDTKDPSSQVDNSTDGKVILPIEDMTQKVLYTKAKGGSEQSPLLQCDIENDGDPMGHLRKNPTSFRISQVILFLVFMVAGVALIGGLIFGVVSFNTVEEELQEDQMAMVNIAGIQIEELDKSPVGEYRFAAVAADAGPCSTIGTNIMAEDRGSVVDAAIAALLCLGIHNAQSMGIGGGHFMMIYDTPKGGEKRQMFSLDSRETAPAAAQRDMFKNSTTTMGGLRAGVPGEIRGMHEAWKRFGRLPWADLFQPTIKICREGYKIGSALANNIASFEWAFEQFPELGKTFTHPDGTIYKDGDTATRLKLADTLEVIANEGPEAFYDGKLTDDLVNDLKDCESIITRKDIEDYKAVWRKPSVIRLQNNLTHYTMPAPSSGPVMQYMLNILEGFNFSASDLQTLDKRVETYHKMVETFKFGYARRSYLGDPDFEDIEKDMEELRSRKFADDTRSHITPNMTHPVEYYKPANKQIQKAAGTSHLSLIGPDGGAVAVTSTVNKDFGCKCVGKRTGIIFNDEMSDFSEPGDKADDGYSSTWANFIEPGKRPMSSMVPSIFLDDNGEPRMVLGTSGGLKILSTTTYVAAHTLFLGKKLNEAIDVPRLHHALIPNEVLHHESVEKKMLAGLKKKGHVISDNSLSTNTQGVWSECGHCRPYCRDPCLYATSDGQKGGYPDGY